MSDDKQTIAELVASLEDAAVSLWVGNHPTEARKIERVLRQHSPASDGRIGAKIEAAFEARLAAPVKAAS